MRHTSYRWHQELIVLFFVFVCFVCLFVCLFLTNAETTFKVKPKFFPVVIHFHGWHLQPKSLVNSFSALIQQVFIKSGTLFLDFPPWLFKEILKIPFNYLLISWPSYAITTFLFINTQDAFDITSWLLYWTTGVLTKQNAGVRKAQHHRIQGLIRNPSMFSISS